MFPSALIRPVARAAVASASSSLRVIAANAGLRTSASASSSHSSTASGSKGRWMSLAVMGGAVALAAAVVQQQQPAAAAAAPASGLNPKEFVPLKLSKREKYNHNTDVFYFALADKDVELNLPVASYVVTKMKGKDGKDVIRPYTPISQHDKGQLVLLVKDYPQGVMSRHFHELKVGDSLEIKGPLPKWPYETGKKKQYGFVAGGTGITPMLQILEEALPQEPNTQFSLLFANTSSKDILLKERIDGLAKKYKNFKATYVIDKAEKDYKGDVGYVSKELLARTMPKASKDSLVFVCGPPKFVELVSGGKTPDYKQGEVTGQLKELGFDSDNVFKL